MGPFRSARPAISGGASNSETSPLERCSRTPLEAECRRLEPHRIPVSVIVPSLMGCAELIHQDLIARMVTARADAFTS
jgi:hypothetical protein